MKIYMDVCCLNRPSDDQTQDKVRFETEAVISILKRCVLDTGWHLIGSDIIALEISKNPDAAKRLRASLMHRVAFEKVKYNEEIKLRAMELQKYHVKLFDSLHLAAAEYANADVFLTTDAQLIRAASRSDIKIRVMNPLAYYLEVLQDEQSGY